MTRSRTAAIAVLTSLGLGVVATYLTFDQQPGIGYSLTIAAFVALLFATSWALDRKPLPINVWLVLPILFFSIMVALRTNATITAINVLAGLAALGLLVVTWDRYPLARLTFFGYGIAAAVAALNAALRAISVIADAGATLAPQQIRRYTRPMVSGTLIAAPFLLLFTLLFASADVIYASAISEMWRGFDLATLTRQTSFALGCACLSTGAIDLALGHRMRTMTARAEQSAWVVTDPAARPTRRWPLGIAETGVALGLVLVLFLSFVLFQLRYLFLPQERLGYTFDTMTYSEYAREGFFQLLVVATVAIVLMVSLEFLTRREKLLHHWIFNGLTVALVASTLIIVASSFRRLQLYGFEHSFTHLRLFSHTFTVWLGVVLLLLAIAVLLGRARILALGTFISLLVYAAGLNLLNVDAFIASANIDHATVYGKQLDRRNFVPLGEDAVPVIVDRLNELDPINRRAIEQLLHYQLQRTRTATAHAGWQSANLAREQALAALQPRGVELAASCAGPPDGDFYRWARSWGSVERQQRLIHDLKPLC
jgi:hypothetical protein